jgi:FdhD protein
VNEDTGGTQMFRKAWVVAVQGDTESRREDCVAAEEPLEIGLTDAPHSEAFTSLAVTMRTPGHDAEIAAGFLWTEGIITDPNQIIAVRPQGPIQPGGWRNRIEVVAADDTPLSLEHSARQFYMTSSCGICGKTSIEAVETARPFLLPHGTPCWSPETIYRMPETLRAAQATFDRTGGLHAAALFDTEGNLLSLREDIGRHNAVDKLVGTAVLAKTLPLSHCLLFVSGRASFELVQKALMAGIPALAAVGAPSSLAVSLAQGANLTLLGFVRGERFNIYAGNDRIAL